MKDLNEYFDLAKIINDISSDYKLAKSLNITPQEISFLRRKDRKIKNETSIKLAELIGCNPTEIIAVSYYELDKKKNREFWEATYNKYSSIKKIINIFNTVNNNSINGNSNISNCKIIQK